MERYNNYHKHDHISNIFTPDVNVHMVDYINRAIELGEPNVWSTNHGVGGDIFELNTLCEKNNLNAKFGIEGYIVPNPLEKDNRNYHIIIIPRTNKARKQLNIASSNANINGYYYKPRFFISDLLAFDPNDLFITTACMAGILKDKDSYEQIFLPLVNHFGKNVFLEVQTHLHEAQKSINEKCLWCKNKYGLRLIGANDSHYIYPEQSKERLEFLKGKGINYGDEDSFILDYPNYDTMVDRFIKQGVLSNSQILEAMESTLILDECENIQLDKEIKMPTIYPNLNNEQKIDKLKNIITQGYKKVVIEDNIPIEKRKLYSDELKKELQVIIDTQKEIHTADYFLFNYEMKNKAVNEYGGVLTRGGRGSCGSYIINKMLGLSQIDRLTTDIPMYSDRFMSTSRLLENRALPDFDFNVKEQEPFDRATKDLLGEQGCYPMVAYGTMQESEAFRNLCRSLNIDYELVNEVSKNIDLYRDNEDWKDIINESQKYVGTIVSASVHPCARLLFNGDIREEIGVIKVGDVLCAMILGSEADEYKYLKNDYLIVTVWEIIDETYKLLGKPIPTIKQVLEKCDEEVWKLFELGMTCTLNQIDGEWATSLLMKFKPKSVEEMCMFVSSIRPSFNNFRDTFIARLPYTTGSKDLDKILEPTYHFVLFQESIMRYFEWLGVSPSESIGLIKKISKKKIKKEDFDKLEDKLKENWIKNTGSIKDFDKTWGDMQECLKYSFNSPHGYSTAMDCLYCAELKAHHPLEYYTTVLNIYSDNTEKTTRLIKEMKYFNITLSNVIFRKSNNKYSYDTSTKTIYKSIGSIKNIGKSCGDNLYALKDNHYNNFIELLTDIKEKKCCNKTELDILIKIDFFREFGEINQLLLLRELYDKYYDSKILSKTKMSKTEIEIIKKYAQSETEKQFRNLDNIGIIKELYSSAVIPPTTKLTKVSYELSLLGYTDIIDTTVDENIFGVRTVEVNKYGSVYIDLYSIKFGYSKSVKVAKKWWEECQCEVGDIIKCSFETKHKHRLVNDEWIESPETEEILKVFCIENT